jgi:acyl-CoA synthetase (AMP-forming)/AMP-acid ligase II
VAERLPQTIPDLLEATASRLADTPAVVDGDRALTYADLLAESRTFAAALVARGVRAGERVSIWMPNSWRWIVAVLGIWQAGGVLVPINTRFKGTEASDILGRAGVRLLVTVTDFLDTDYVAMLEGA